MRSWTNATAPSAGSGGAPAAEVPAPVRGVLRPDETQRLVDLRRDHPVAAALRPFVERYWSVRWDLTGRPPYRSEVLSHPSVNVSVESGTHPRFGFTLPAVLVHGVVTSRFTVDLVGAGRVTAVKFRPGGFTAFTGRQAARDRVSRLGDVLGLDPAELADAVLAEDDDTARAAALDGALAPHAREPEPAYLELLDVLAAMPVDRSLIRVDDVAARAGLSVRALQRLFAAYVGVSPKAVLARYRLQDAAASIDAGIESGEATDLAALAASLGWYDQAHFSRDFRAVVGVTPGAYLRRMCDGQSRAQRGSSSGKANRTGNGSSSSTTEPSATSR